MIETVREKFFCRDCEKIGQAPAPFHAVPRGWAGSNLLAMIMFEKFGQHQPLNRQAERHALDGAPIALSTIADARGIGRCVPGSLLLLVDAHVLAAERLHADDTTVLVPAKGKTATGMGLALSPGPPAIGGTGPTAAMFYYSRDRKGAHPHIWLDMPASCRPTPTTTSIWPGDGPGRSARRPASFCPGTGCRFQRTPLERHDYTRQQGPSRHYHYQRSRRISVKIMRIGNMTSPTK